VIVVAVRWYLRFGLSYRDDHGHRLPRRSAVSHADTEISAL